MTEEEKKSIKNLTMQFLVRHDYFGLIWKTLSNDKKEKVLDIIAAGEGIIPYEK